MSYGYSWEDCQGNRLESHLAITLYHGQLLLIFYCLAPSCVLRAEPLIIFNNLLFKFIYCAEANVGASPANTYSIMYVHAKWMIIRFCDTIVLHPPPTPSPPLPFQHFALSERNCQCLVNRWTLNKIPTLAPLFSCSMHTCISVILLSLGSVSKKILKDAK